MGEQGTGEERVCSCFPAGVGTGFGTGQRKQLISSAGLGDNTGASWPGLSALQAPVSPALCVIDSPKTRVASDLRRPPSPVRAACLPGGRRAPSGPAAAMEPQLSLGTERPSGIFQPRPRCSLPALGPGGIAGAA